MRLRKLRPRYLVLGGLVGLGCGIAVSELSGEGPLHDRAPPPFYLNYPCTPNRATWGYYPPKWRRWPGTLVEPEPVAPLDGAGLPETAIPSPEEEDVRVPTPVTPGGPLQGAPSPGPAVPPAMEQGPAAPGAFAPTPAAPLPDAGLPVPGAGAPAPDLGIPTPGIPAAPLPDAPLPTAPLPNGLEPEPGPINPFGGTSATSGPSQLEEDPPPALPPSLQSSRRARDARRTADQTGGRSRFARNVTRLPTTSMSRMDTLGRYDVQQASATVWASGTEDIRSVDPNAGRIEQAIHHEPIE